MHTSLHRSRSIVAVIATIVLLAGIGTFIYLQNHKGSPAVHTPPPPGTPQPTKTAAQCIEALPLATKVGQKLMPAVYSDQLDSELPVLKKYQIGGVIVMDTITTPHIDSLRSTLAPAPFIAVDQEGGTVQRYKEQGILPGASTIARTLIPSQAYDAYLRDSTYLQQHGITTNFAPVVDVESHTPSPLPGRMYSNDPSIITTYARQAIRAAKAAGITPVIKHFPGLGSADGNTDYTSVTIDPLATLQTRDLIPYKDLAAEKSDLMISNAIVPGLTGGQPAVWSADAVALARSLGYSDSVIYSDSLTARAVPGELDDATIKAWQAGIDVAVIVQTRQQTPSLEYYLQTITAKAEQPDKAELNHSVARIFARKQIDPCQISGR